MKKPPPRKDTRLPPDDKRARGASRVSGAQAEKFHESIFRRGWQRLRYVCESCLKALTELGRHPLSSLLTCSVISIALTLPAGLFLVLKNLQRSNAQWDNAIQITLFTHENVAFAQTAKLAEDIRQWPSVTDVKVLSPEAALSEYERIIGTTNLVGALGGKNPFPAVVLVSLDRKLNNPASIAAFAEKIKVYGKLHAVTLDQTLVNRLYILLDIGNRGLLILSVIFALAVTLVIGNTIRLDIDNKREEILVIKLVGGTDGYVRWPLVFQGMWYGICGSILTWIVTFLAVAYLGSPLNLMSVTDGSYFKLSALGFAESLSLTAISALLGMSAAWVITTRRLRRIELN